jgi:hypothetical protein
MQWYAQDTLASSSASTAPFDFSVNPDHHLLRHPLPAAANFFSYYTIGNVGFITFSNAHGYAAYESAFAEACAYFGEHPPSVIYLMGHWTNCDGDWLFGCSEVRAQ